MRKDSVHRLVWVFVFGVTMGFFEAAVVVYLRELYHPDGFRFPTLAYEAFDELLLVVEIVREAMSLLMLLAVGMLAGRRGLERFAFFLYAFGVWDIFYYVFLYLTLDWPASPATWDLLFLIPLPWVGPVWAPATVALAFIVTTVALVIHEDRGRPLCPTLGEWSVAVLGGVVIVVSFCWEGPNVMAGGIPQSFPWWIWLFGMVLGLGAFARTVRRANQVAGI